jgi:hypothetical protein
MKRFTKYTQWFKAASAAGVNVARVWMAAWDMGIEWADTGLGDYSKRLDRAWALDQVFAIGEKYGVNIDLVLLNHGAFSESTNPEFFSSPYNSSNGGPISDPAKFVTDPTSIKFWHQRLRYIAARWGAEPNLFSWEWWNEVNFTPLIRPNYRHGLRIRMPSKNNLIHTNFNNNILVERCKLAEIGRQSIT